jgi:hypothetical protein
MKLRSISPRNFRVLRINVISNRSVKLDRVGEIVDFRWNVRDPVQRMLWLSRCNICTSLAMRRILNLGSYDFAAHISDDEHILCCHIYVFPPPERLKNVEFQPGLAVFSTKQLYDQSVPPLA